MPTLCRLVFVAALLASYVAGLGVHAATSSAMVGKMVMSDSGDMRDCQDCDPAGGGDPASPCDISCLTPMAATLASGALLWAPLPVQARDTAGASFASRTGPPEPSPPRTVLLI